MKPSKLFGFILLIITTVVACGKKDSDLVTDATVQYNITTTNRTSGLVQFSSGTAASKQIAFKGTSSTRVEQYQLNFNSVDLFTASAPIASVMVPPGTYGNAEFNFQMSPTRNPALQLKGTYNGTPLTINIDNFVEISTKLPTVTLESGKTYNANLQLNLEAAMSGITATQLNNATRTNGEIVIGTFSNTGLLQTILNNINNVIPHVVVVN